MSPQQWFAREARVKRGEYQGNALCAYCGKQRAVNRDHVIPRAQVRSYNRRATLDMPSIPAKWLDVVPACFECNIRKGTRRLVPPAWAKEVNAMNTFFGGVPWRVWTGDPTEPAYRATHV